MAGAPLTLTFSDAILASPTSSPMPFDAPSLGQDQEYMDALFSVAFPDNTSHAYANSYELPTTGLGLTVESAPDREQGVNPEVLRLASPAVEHAADPAATPLPKDILESRRRPLTFTPSFFNLAAGGSSSGAVDAQPLYIDPAVLRPHADDADAETVVDGLDEQESGSDAEDEASVMPSSTSTLPVPLPDDVDGKIASADSNGHRGTKRAASGEPTRASKRRRRSSSDDDEDFQPAPRTTRQRRAAREPALQIGAGETAAEVRARTCARCWRKFGREAELVRHLRQSACGTADKRACPVCKGRLSLRSDAFSRHLRETRKCLAIQATMTPEQLAALGCFVPPQDGEAKVGKKGKAKKAKGKKAQ